MATRQLSDGNDDGTVLGQNSSDKLGFYGTNTPVAKQTCTLAAALTAATTTPANIAAALVEIRTVLVALNIIA